MKNVTMSEMATVLSMDKTNLQRYAVKKGFVFNKVRTPKGQQTLSLTKSDFDKLVSIRKKEGFGSNEPVNKGIIGNGCFYIIQLIPDEIPKRIKLGYTSDLNARILSHRVTCPDLKILSTIKCKQVWECALIDILTKDDSTQISKEVFDVKDVAAFLKKAENCFKLFPAL